MIIKRDFDARGVRNIKVGEIQKGQTQWEGGGQGRVPGTLEDLG